VILHLRPGEVDQERVDLLLICRLLREDVLNSRAGAEGSEFGVVGDVEEALAILWSGESETGEFERSVERVGGWLTLTLRNSHFSSSVTHLVSPGDNSM
jgi:hypothetical protein